MVAEVMAETGAILVPPYDHPDIMLGQGTAGMEMEEQYLGTEGAKSGGFDAVLAPLGGGGLLSGTAIWYSDKPGTMVFGAEPNYQGGNDGEMGLKADPPRRIETVKTLTIADGLRTPVGKNPWGILTGGNSVKRKFVESVYSVTDDQIKAALKLVMERMKVFVEPSAVVPLAVILFNDEFRRMVAERQKEGEVWDVGVIFSGGNTTIEALIAMFGAGDGVQGEEGKRAEGVVGLDGRAVAENIAG
jgi:threonine dehydratase